MKLSSMKPAGKPFQEKNPLSSWALDKGVRWFITTVKRNIVRVGNGAGNGSAWAFIDRTNGDILKPASYKAPAKD